jgi:hypothetical protein
MPRSNQVDTFLLPLMPIAELRAQHNLQSM